MKKILAFFLSLLAFSSFFTYMPLQAYADPDSVVSDTSSNFKVSLQSINPGIVQRGSNVDVKVQLENLSSIEQKNVHVTLRINSALMVNRSQIQNWSEGHPGGTSLASQNVDTLAGQGKTEVTLTANASDLDQYYESWGTRGINIEVTQNDSPQIVVMTSSFIVLNANDTYKPLKIVPVTSLTAPSGSYDANGSLNSTDGNFAENSALQKTLKVVENNPFSVIIDNGLLNDTSKSTNDNTKKWYQAFNNTAKEKINLPAYDPDVMAVSRLPGETPYQDFLTKLQLTSTSANNAINNFIWPAEGKVDANQISKIATSDDTLFLNSSNFSARSDIVYTPDALTNVAINPINTAKAVVADNTLSQLLSLVNSSTNQTQLNQRFLAETATITREQPSVSRHIVVATERNWDTDPSKVSALLAAMSQAPWINFSTMADTLAGTPNTSYGNLNYSSDDEKNELNSTLISQAETLRNNLLNFSHIVKGTSTLGEEGSKALGETASNAFRNNKNDQTSFFNAWNNQAGSIENSIEIVKTSNLNLLNNSAEVKFLVVNKHDETVTLKINATTSNTKLKAESPPVIEIEAGRQANVVIPLKAISVGDAVLTLTPETLDGQSVGKSVSVPVSMNIEWGNIFTNVILGTAILLVLLGIYRTVKKNIVTPKNKKHLEDDF